MEDQLVEPYYCKLPVYVRATGERASVQFPVMPPHLALRTYSDSELADVYEKVESEGVLALESYRTHPVVKKNAASRPLPVALYCDGISQRRNHSCLAMTAQFCVGGLQPK
eukprot:1504010-Amphidinium_carterae.1